MAIFNWYVSSPEGKSQIFPHESPCLGLVEHPADNSESAASHRDLSLENLRAGIGEGTQTDGIRYELLLVCQQCSSL
jgi:hypothetical protein